MRKIPMSHKKMAQSGIEPLTSRLSGARSNQTELLGLQIRIYKTAKRDSTLNIAPPNLEDTGLEPVTSSLQSLRSPN